MTQNFAKTCKHPVYLLRLNLCTSRNWLKLLLGTQEPGACHVDDLGYVFDGIRVPTAPLVGSIEEKAINRHMSLIGNFLKHGNPTPDENEFNLSWKSVTKDELYYLDFDEELSVKINPDQERMGLWRDIYRMRKETEHFLL